jgi:hypothetical protein
MDATSNCGGDAEQQPAMMRAMRTGRKFFMGRYTRSSL